MSGRTKPNKLIKARDGVQCIVMHKKRILLLKRRNVPFIENPGIWSFVMGGRGRREAYAHVAFRELEEETRLTMRNVRIIGRPRKMVLFNIPKPEQRWSNMVFLLCSDTDKVKMNFETTKHRWASFDEIRRHRSYSNIFVDEALLLKMIKSAVSKCAGSSV